MAFEPRERKAQGGIKRKMSLIGVIMKVNTRLAYFFLVTEGRVMLIDNDNLGPIHRGISETWMER
jgi:hypothetical protein